MEEKITFQNSKGRKLSGILGRPAGNREYPAVVICHGFTGNKDERKFEKLAAALNEQNIVTLRFDFTGNGESEGEFSEGNFTQETDDVKSAIDELSELSFVDKSNIGVVGHSMGGCVCILAAKKDKRIKAVVTLSAALIFQSYGQSRFGDQLEELEKKGYFLFSCWHPNGIVREYKVTQEFIDSVKKTDVIASVKDIMVPVLFLYGTNDGDSSTPETIKELFENANFPKLIEFIEGADHNYTDARHEQEMVGHAVEFFRRYLNFEEE